MKSLKILKDYLFLTLGAAVFTISWEFFMIPNGMSAGGLMGLCTVLQFLTAIDAGIYYAVINAVLIIAAVLLFGIGFGFRTIYCITLSSVLMQLSSNMDFMFSLPGNFFYIREPFLIPVLAGVMEACGVGLIIRFGGSTGGTDIIALVANKYWPVSFGRVFLVTDMIVICSLLIVPGKIFADMVYGFEMMVSFSFVIDTVIGGQKSTMQVFIFSSKVEQIADFVTNVMNRGATLLKAVGWFTKSPKDVLMVMMRRNELPYLSSAVKEMDPKAFISISQTSFVYGEGFEEIKSGFKKKKSNGNSK